MEPLTTDTFVTNDVVTLAHERIITDIIHPKPSENDIKNDFVNGIHEQTTIIRYVDDTFINVPCDVIIIDKYDLSAFWKHYEECIEQRRNVIIDSRMWVLISYAIIKYDTDVIIYDVYNNTLQSLYTFTTECFKVQSNELTLTQIKQLFISKLVIVHFLKYYDIGLNTNDIIKCIKKNDSLIVALINYIGINRFGLNNVSNNYGESINPSHVSYICGEFTKDFGRDQFTVSRSRPIAAMNRDTKCPSSWDLSNITRYELFTALTHLSNIAFSFNIRIT